MNDSLICSAIRTDALAVLASPDVQRHATRMALDACTHIFHLRMM
jgi:hypothetical protein